MATSSPIGTLPPELLTRVFSLIEEKTTIASCRLVCRDFRELSSPYLITRIVLAKRVDAISRLFDVLEHPYFRQHVTELLYDASYYDYDLANDPERYAYARERSERGIDDYDADERRDAYLAVWRRANAMFDGSESIPPSHEDRSIEDTAINDAPESVYQRFHYEYSQSHEYQEMVLLDNLHRIILVRLCKELPKLHHIVFGDYRNLAKILDPTQKPSTRFIARNEKRVEPFHCLCTRIVGKALEPWAAGMPECNRYKPWDELIHVLSVLDKAKNMKLRTFEIGGHPYEPLPGPDEFRPDHQTYCLPPALHLDHTSVELMSGIEDGERMQGLRGIRSLRLPLLITPASGLFAPDDSSDDNSVDSSETPDWTTETIKKSIARSLMTYSSKSLTHLQLMRQEDEGFAKFSAKHLDAGDLGSCLEHILFPLSFPCLKHLDLRQWPLPINSFKEFLLTHASTLRELRLLENVVVSDDPISDDDVGDDVSDDTSLAGWAGNTLHLQGVEICNFMKSYNYGPCKGTWDTDYDNLWLAGRPNSLEPVIKISYLGHNHWQFSNFAARRFVHLWTHSEAFQPKYPRWLATYQHPVGLQEWRHQPPVHYLTSSSSHTCMNYIWRDTTIDELKKKGHKHFYVQGQELPRHI